MLNSPIRSVTVLMLILVPGGCHPTPTPGLNSRTADRVIQRFASQAPGQIERPWTELQEELGPGETITFQEFLDVTGYDVREPDRVECRIWRNERGEWLAVAYDPAEQSLCGIKSYMRK